MCKMIVIKLSLENVSPLKIFLNKEIQIKLYKLLSSISIPKIYHTDWVYMLSFNYLVGISMNLINIIKANFKFAEIHKLKPNIFIDSKLKNVYRDKFDNLIFIFKWEIVLWWNKKQINELNKSETVLKISEKNQYYLWLHIFGMKHLVYLMLYMSICVLI